MVKVIERCFTVSSIRVELAYLFGSQITGHAGKASDVDIAVLMPDDMTRMERFNARLKLMGELEKYLQKPIDLVVLNDVTSIFFRFVIISEGVRCFIPDRDVLLDYELRTMNEYIDFKPFLDEYNTKYVEKYSK